MPETVIITVTPFEERSQAIEPTYLPEIVHETQDCYILNIAILDTCSIASFPLRTFYYFSQSYFIVLEELFCPRLSAIEDTLENVKEFWEAGDNPNVSVIVVHVSMCIFAIYVIHDHIGLREMG